MGRRKDPVSGLIFGSFKVAGAILKAADKASYSRILQKLSIP